MDADRQPLPDDDRLALALDYQNSPQHAEALEDMAWQAGLELETPFYRHSGRHRLRDSLRHLRSYYRGLAFLMKPGLNWVQFINEFFRPARKKADRHARKFSGYPG